MPDNKMWEKRKDEFMNPVIKTEDQFWDVFNDSKNQFMGIRLMSSKLNDQDLIEKNETIPYVNFAEHLKNTNQSLSKEFLDNKQVKDLIAIYDGLIERIKVFKTREEFNQIMEEVVETMDRFILGIKNEE